MMPRVFPSKRVRVDREGPVQAAVVQRLRFELPGAVVHHSPNEDPSPSQRRRAAAMGLEKGFPDVVVLLKHRGHPCTLLFEVKAPAEAGKRAGQLSSEQSAMLLRLRYFGHFCAVIYSQDEAVACLDDWGIARRSAVR